MEMPQVSATKKQQKQQKRADWNLEIQAFLPSQTKLKITILAFFYTITALNKYLAYKSYKYISCWKT